MECPKCGFVQYGNAADCPRCGIVFARFLQAHASVPVSLSPPHAASVQADLERLHAERNDLERELRVRVVALPGALLSAWMAMKAARGLVRMFSMWVHESGHAATAWLCGYSAWPGAWITPVA